MGLSDDERFKGLVLNISEMNQLPKIEKWQGWTNPHTKLNALTEQLCPALFGSGNNSSHWILGGELSSDHFGDFNTVGIAFQSVMDSFIGDETDEESFLDPKTETSDYLKNYWPDMIRLVEKYDNDDSTVLKLFLHTETAFYYLNRYDDDFRKKFVELGNILAKIKGECFKLFSQNPVYAKAYFADNILSKIKSYNDDDLIVKWFVKHNLHHHIALKDLDNKEVFRVFQEFRKTRTVSTQRKIEVVLKFLGGHYHYVHQHKELFKMVEEYNATAESKVDLEKIKKLCEACTKKHVDEKENGYKYEPYCHLTNETINPDELVVARKTAVKMTAKNRDQNEGKDC